MNDTPETSILGVATITDHNGNDIVISAKNLEELQAYLEAKNETGAAAARKVAIILGPFAS